MEMMNNVGVTPKSLHQKWQFGVEMEGFTAALFTKANLPEMEFDEVTFSPGGAIFDQKAAGRVKFSDTTLEMGELQDNQGDELLDWVHACASFVTNSGTLPQSYLKELDIVCYDRAGKEYKRYRLHGAWAKSINLGELEGGASDNTVRSITIAYNYFTKI